MKYKQIYTLRAKQSLLALSLSLANQQILAQTDSELEELVVWGTQVRASSVQMEGEALAIRQADHISDLLRTIPGVDVGGAHSLNQRITIRSMDDKDLRIRIDGANQNTYMYHHMGNLQIHADILQSVDVQIGNNSIINGGLGGSVNFDTKSASQLLTNNKQFGSRVQASYGDNSGTSLALTGFGQLSENLDFLGYFNNVDRKNYEVGGGRILDQNNNLVAGTDGTVRGLKGEVEDILVKLGWDLDSNQRLELGYEAYQDEGRYSYRPDMGLATDLAITNSLGIPLLWPTEFGRDTLTLKYTLQWGQNSSLRASLFQNESTLDRDESGWAANPAFASSAGQIEGEAENSGLYVLAESTFNAHTLTYGLEFINYDTDYTALYSASTDSGSEEAINRSVFIQDSIRLGDNLYLIPGIRYDSFDIDSAVVDDTFDKFSGSLAVEYDLTENLVARVSGTQLFKGPEIGEVFIGAGLFDIANPDIQQETGLNTELSLAFEDNIFGADRFSAGVTFFDTEIDDYIYDYATPPPSVGGRAWKDNIGDMTIEGVEAYIGYDIRGLKTLLTWSESDSDLNSIAEYSALEGARLDRQQGDTLSLNVDYEFSDLNLTVHWDVLSVEGVSAGRDLDGATLNNSKDSYTVHNISARWKPESINRLTLTAGVDNLFDEFFSSQSSRTGVSFHPRFGQLYLFDYEPGRNLKITASYDF
ncbi:TonB-dependent receptor [Gammaproteobacteria bacterium]|nr:TonB-dependent receptor [Gammaproteobacteria bacterium]